MLYIICFSIGMGGTSYPFTAEVLPPIGMGISMFTQWIFTGLIGYFTPSLAEIWIGVLPLMIIFASICTIGFFILDYFVIETKNKADKEISEAYLRLPYKFLRFK